MFTLSLKNIRNFFLTTAFCCSCNIAVSQPKADVDRDKYEDKLSSLVTVSLKKENNTDPAIKTVAKENQLEVKTDLDLTAYRNGGEIHQPQAPKSDSNLIPATPDVIIKTKQRRGQYTTDIPSMITED